jgi:hypothetical protein
LIAAVGNSWVVCEGDGFVLVDWIDVVSDVVTNTVLIDGVALLELVEVELIKVVDEVMIVELEVDMVILVALGVVMAVVVDVTIETANGQQSGLSFTHPTKAA